MSKQLAAQAPVEPIVLGKMGSPYGIRGWLRVFSSTEDAESIFDYQPWFIQKAGQWQQVQLESWKHHNQDMIIKLKGVDDRDAANLLTMRLVSRNVSYRSSMGRLSRKSISLLVQSK